MALEMGILLAVLALIGWGASPALLKKVIDSLGTYTCLLFNHLVLTVIIAVTALFTIRLVLPSDIVTAVVIIGAAMGAVTTYLVYKAVSEGKVSVVSVIVSLYVIWTVVLSYFIFGERLQVLQYVSIGVIFLGVVMVALEKPGLPKKPDWRHISLFLQSGIWSRGSLIALVASFCYALYNLASKYAVGALGPHVTVVYLEALIMVFILLAFMAKSPGELVKLPKRRHLKWLVPSALLYAGGAAAFYFSMKYVPLSVTAPIVAAAPAVTAVVAVSFIDERLKVHQYAGIVVAVLGIVFLSM